MPNWTEIRKQYLGEPVPSILPFAFKLPPMPQVLMEFSRKADDPDADPAELAEIIASDAVLTCDLLHYVNSCAMGLRHKASSARQAIRLLGIRASKLLVLSKAVQRLTTPCESKLIEIRSFWAANLERALFAQEVAKRLGTDSDLAFAAGMLQDFLLPLLANELFSEYQGFCAQQQARPIELTTLERDAIGVDHAQAAAHLMCGWKFPDDLVCSVLFHHRGLRILDDDRLGSTAAAATAISALLPGSLHQVPDGLEQLTKLDSQRPEFKVLDIAKRVDEQFDALSPATVNRPSLFEQFEDALLAAG